MSVRVQGLPLQLPSSELSSSPCDHSETPPFWFPDSPTAIVTSSPVAPESFIPHFFPSPSSQPSPVPPPLPPSPSPTPPPAPQFPAQPVSPHAPARIVAGGQHSLVVRNGVVQVSGGTVSLDGLRKYCTGNRHWRTLDKFSGSNLTYDDCCQHHTNFRAQQHEAAIQAQLQQEMNQQTQYPP
ncbi:hypothetical protein M422DRAFT_250396 [Sphaerobolus stellatus SS14]|uniref:Unplaced genomic scaffold SPHSTscaffold_34, whole genome shotgun sequence n=1 Tax=Sphaerobolus stellatus (strain SS14) TaxID=990650 RepID=A0A0C9W2V5_SPHS4|nr:hypothetical protein M422DRAFT_250396 [Sphaerobolus stellatus SS14]